VGEKHLKLTLQVPDSDQLIDAIAFNTEQVLLENRLATITVVYRLDVNEFRGVSNVQLMVDAIVDYALA
jgi:single-stranded-DNA-specific exonuclease